MSAVLPLVHSQYILWYHCNMPNLLHILEVLLSTNLLQVSELVEMYKIKGIYLITQLAICWSYFYMVDIGYMCSQFADNSLFTT